MRNQRLFAVAAALAFGLTGGAHAIDSEGCKTEWEESTAYQTCEAGTVTSWHSASTLSGTYQSENGNSCRISTRCLKPSTLGPDHYYVNANAWTMEDDTDDLENCLGTLKVGSC